MELRPNYLTRCDSGTLERVLEVIDQSHWQAPGFCSWLVGEIAYELSRRTKCELGTDFREPRPLELPGHHELLDALQTAAGLAWLIRNDLEFGLPLPIRELVHPLVDDTQDLIMGEWEYEADRLEQS
jgi:hypothetical protein